jgi:hypothetical protein
MITTVFMGATLPASTVFHKFSDYLSRGL